MEKRDTASLEGAFDGTFKFAQNQEVRHKADSKSSFSADMGLLVIARTLVERLGDDDVRIFERHYHCRMIRFSGSGEVNQFSEKELISIEEYNAKKEKDDAQRDGMRNDARQTGEEVFKLFGVTQNTHVHAKSDNSKEYRITGWSIMEGKMKITATEVLSSIDKAERKHIEFTSKDEFTVVQTELGKTGRQGPSREIDETD